MNFFRPVMKLVSKERIGGKVKRKYDKPRTPYERLVESGQIPEQMRLQLEATYLSLNPAELKSEIKDGKCELPRWYGASELKFPHCFEANPCL